MGYVDYDSLIEAALLELEQVNITILSLSSNKRAAYSIDTGQTKESVTAIRLAELRAHRAALIADIEYWTSMLDTGSQHTYTRVGF